MRRFWNWEESAPTSEGPASETGRVLRISGVVAEESWFEDDITPALFAYELNAGSGDAEELGRAIDMLAAVKDSIVNAYELKTGMSRAKLAKLMDAETWMDARVAIVVGFADEYLTRNAKHDDPDEDDDRDEESDVDEPDEDEPDAPFPPGKPKKQLPSNLTPLRSSAGGVVYDRKPAEQRLVAHLTDHRAPTAPQPVDSASAEPVGRRVVDLYATLTNQAH